MKGSTLAYLLGTIAVLHLSQLSAASDQHRPSSCPASGVPDLHVELDHRAAGLSEALVGHFSKHAARYARDLAELVAIPSVSALPEHFADILKAAEWVSRRLHEAGLRNASILPTEGPHPVVYAEWLEAGPDVPTVLIYGHYDVQPVDPLQEWRTPPFQAVVDGDFVSGRGVDDDKGGLLQPIHAVEALLAAAGKLPLNVKFMLEGQEEIMSPHLRNFLLSHAQLLSADVVLSADGSQPASTQGGLSLGMRGVASLQVDVSTASSDMHSGAKGGSVPNPNHVLAQILASLHDPNTGEITVPGFYEGVQGLTDADAQDVAAFSVYDSSEELAKLGLQGFSGEDGYGTLERRWFRPTLEVVGMSGGYGGAGIKTVIPRAASAKISCRLVEGQQPADIVRKVTAHINSLAPSWANVSVMDLGGGCASWSSQRHSTSNRAAAAVLADVFGVPPLYYRDGSTIPALALFQSVLGLESTKFGFGLGDRIHAPNERVLVSMLEKGRRAWAQLLLTLPSAQITQQETCHHVT
ncbi:MAG: hypothetical protein WDW36_000883 [Sanguina aurantia]